MLTRDSVNWTDTVSALEVLHSMRYINLRLTYLLYLLSPIRHILSDETQIMLHCILMMILKVFGETSVTAESF